MAWAGAHDLSIWAFSPYPGSELFDELHSQRRDRSGRCVLQRATLLCRQFGHAFVQRTHQRPRAARSCAGSAWLCFICYPGCGAPGGRFACSLMCSRAGRNHALNWRCTGFSSDCAGPQFGRRSKVRRAAKARPCRARRNCGLLNFGCARDESWLWHCRHRRNPLGCVLRRHRFGAHPRTLPATRRRSMAAQRLSVASGRMRWASQHFRRSPSTTSRRITWADWRIGRRER